MKTKHTPITVIIAGVMTFALQITTLAGPFGSVIPGGGVPGERIPSRADSASAPVLTNATAPAAPLKTGSTTAANAISTNGLIGFDKLAGFDIELTSELVFTTNRSVWADAQVNAMIPTNIMALDGRSVSVKGFMVPMEFDKSKVIQFMLVRDPPTCCFGGLANVHQFVEVSVQRPGTSPRMYEPVLARGVLHVGARRVDGSLTSVYRMEAETVSVAPEK